MMRTVLLALAASLVAATPALAGEARVEARGGIAFSSGTEEAVAGVAAGYDFDLAPGGAFVGAEVSADHIIEDGFKAAFGFTGRAGTALGGAGKLFAAGGYTTEFCEGCDDSWHAGVGYEHGFGPGVYGKLEYRHYFFDQGSEDGDVVAAGLGLRF